MKSKPQMSPEYRTLARRYAALVTQVEQAECQQRHTSRVVLPAGILTELASVSRQMEAAELAHGQPEGQGQ